jgi:hypothetical protein
MRYQPHLRVMANLNAEMAKAEREVARWEKVIERMGAAGEPTHKAREFLRGAQDEVDRLDRARDVLLEGEDGPGEGRPALSPS